MNRFLWLTAFFLCLLLFGSCSSRGEDKAPPSSSAPAASSASSSPSLASSLVSDASDGTQNSSGTTQEYALPFQVEGDSPDTGALALAGNTSPVVVPGGSTLFIHLQEAAEVNYLRLSPQAGCPTNIPLTLSSGGTVVAAKKDPADDSLILRFDTIKAQDFTLSLGETGTEYPLLALEVGCLPGGASAGAYLPAATPADTLDAYRSSFAVLERVTVITGLCWDKNGKVQVLDQNLPLLLEKLSSLRAEYGFSLYATVFPSSRLRSEGLAGDTVATPEQRAVLAESLSAFAAEWELDGIDFDWEFPASPSEWESYGALLLETAKQLEEDSRGISFALYPENLSSLPSQAANAGILHLMVYDQFDEDGYHATFSAACSAIADAKALGYQEISLGIPTYGRPLDGSAIWPLWRDLPSDSESCVIAGVYYNTPSLARSKAALAQLEGLSGVFFYHLVGDLPLSDTRSLLGAVD